MGGGVGDYKRDLLAKVKTKFSTGAVYESRISGTIMSVRRPRGASFSEATVEVPGGKMIETSFQPFQGLSPGTMVEFDLVKDGRMRTGSRAKNVRAR